MNKYLLTTLIICLASNNSLFAESLSECRTISNDQDRLECYDQITIKSEDNQNNTAATTKVAPYVADIKAKTVEPASLASKPTQAKKLPPITATTKKSSAQENFGLETVNSSDVINTTILGEFKGWEKGTIFQLANGQKWKVSKSDSRPVYRRSTQNPKVKITRGFLNSYKMEVDGVNRSVKVKRVK